MTFLQKAILSTLVYYNALDYPLTSFEVFKYLVNPSRIAPSKDFEIDRFSKISLANIRKNLESRELKKFIEEKNGFYFLKGRKEIIRTRIDRQKIADQKWKKAKKIIRRLQIIPYMRMVAVSGSLALNNTRAESDIDVLIVVKAGRIWLTRFFVTVFLQLMGRRRHKKATKDRICLNHYIIDKSLEIKFRSLYNAQTYAHMIPVLEVKYGIYDKFQKANRWVKDYLVSWPTYTKVSASKPERFKTLKTNSLLKSIGKMGEVCLNSLIGNLLEKRVKAIQKKSIEKDPLTRKKGGRITVDDTQLEFHPDSPERKILDRYNESMLYLGVKELKEKDSGLL